MARNKSILTEAKQIERAVTLINLAACEEKTNKLAEALGHWVEARSRAQIEGNSAIQEEAEKRAKVLEPRLARLTVVVDANAPKDVEIERDGVALGSASFGIPLPVNPGAHTLVVKAKGYADARATVTLAEAERRQMKLQLGAKLPDAPVAERGGAATNGGTTSRGTSPLVYVGFGLAAAGVAVGTVTGIVALGAASDADAACPNGRCRTDSEKSDAESGKTMGTVSTIGFIAGGVGALVGIYGLVWGSPKSKTTGSGSSNAASIDVSVGPTGGVLRGTF